MPQPAEPFASDSSGVREGKPTLLNGRSARSSSTSSPAARSNPPSVEKEEQRDGCEAVPSPREQPRYAAVSSSSSLGATRKGADKSMSDLTQSNLSARSIANGRAGGSQWPQKSQEEEEGRVIEFSAWDSPPATAGATTDGGRGDRGQVLEATTPSLLSTASAPESSIHGAVKSRGRISQPPDHRPAENSAEGGRFLGSGSLIDGETEEEESNIYTFSETHTGRVLTRISSLFLRTPERKSTHSGSALAGFLALLLVTCANYVLSPMRDAAALAVGVNHIPHLTLASTVLALASSVPMGWLFEAPNPERGGLSWRRRVGLTRGETQGTSLALFYRVFAISLVGYAAGFKVVEFFGTGGSGSEGAAEAAAMGDDFDDAFANLLRWPPSPSALASLSVASVPLLIRSLIGLLRAVLSRIVHSEFGTLFYVAFFLVVHLMKLHSLSLIWGVASEAMEYEERAEKREQKKREAEEEAAAVAAIAAATERVEVNGQGGSRIHKDLPQHPNDPTAVTGLRRRKKHAPKLSSIPSGEAIAGVRPTSDEEGEADCGGNCSDKPADVETARYVVPGQEEDCGNKETASAPARSQDLSKAGNAKSAAPTAAAPNRARSRLRRLAFVGLGGTIGGILGSVLASAAAGTLHLSGLLVVAAVLLELSAELSVELGRIMLRHWEEEQIALLEEMARDQRRRSGQQSSLSCPAVGDEGDDGVDSSMKRVRSLGSMKRVASGGSLSGKGAGFGGGGIRSSATAGADGMRKAQSSITLSAMAAAAAASKDVQGMCREGKTQMGGGPAQDKVGHAPSSSSSVSRSALDDSNSFKQRLLRGVTTILRSRLLMCIFTYNALAATTSVLLSFQRAELVANRGGVGSGASAEKDTAFLARINMASSVAVFGLQASGAGALLADSCGRYGTLALMPLVRVCGVAGLAWWHVKGSGRPPNLALFLVLDEFAKVINFAVAKPVRESLWRGLSNEARYEAKPIVDTLANRWGGGSAAFLTSFLGTVLEFTGWGHVSKVDGSRTVLGFPPVLILCTIAAVWWTVVSLDLGNIRRRIDLELKKHQ